MKKLLTLFLMCFVMKAVGQTVIYSQNFNTGSASDWSLNTTDLGGDASLLDNQWVINNIYAGGLLAGATANEPAAIVGSPNSYYMHIFSSLGMSLGQPANDNFDAGGTGATYFAAQSTPISTVGYTGVTFSFWWLCQGDATCVGKVYYRTSAGGAWTQIMTPISSFFGSSSWNKDSVTSSAFDGQAFLEFGFQFTDGSAAGLDPAFGIDDIIVTGNSGSAPPTITTGPAAASVCTGTSASFTATVTGATSYQWQRSTTGLAGPFVNITAGMDGGIYGSSYTTATLMITAPTVTENGYAYQLVATNTSGSVTSSPALLTVTTTPSAGTISGVGTICVGATGSLSDGVAGGTWSSSNPFVASVGSTGVVTGSSAGTATISYTVVSSCGTAIATFNITVTTSATAGTITGLGTVCAGNHITLSDAAGGGTWTSASTAVATVDGGGVVTGVTVGIDVISYNVTSSCGTATATYTITVNAAASAGTVTGATTVCKGSTITVSDATSGGTWSVSNTNATVGTSGNVTGANAGVDTVAYTITGGVCGTASSTIVVTVEPLPNPIVHALPGHTLSVTGAYTSYQWLKNGTPIPGATNSSYVFTVSANYQVIVDSGSCMDTSGAHVFNLAVGNLATSGNAFHVLQDGGMAILFADVLLTSDLQVRVFDLSGRQVTTDQWPAGTTTFRLNDYWYAPGVYLLRLTGEQTNVVLRWQKE